MATIPMLTLWQKDKCDRDPDEELRIPCGSILTTFHARQAHAVLFRGREINLLVLS